MSRRDTRAAQIVAALLAVAMGLAAGAGWGALVLAGLLLTVVPALMRSKHRATTIFIAVGSYLLFSDRVVLKLSGFGSGIVPIMGVATVALAGIAIAEPGSRWVWSRVSAEARGVLPFIGVAVLYPILGVISGYPARTAMSVVPPLVMAALVVLGAVAYEDFDDFWNRAFRMFGFVAVVELLVGLMQGMANVGLVTPLTQGLWAWDSTSAALYGAEAIAGRSSGLFINPNVYSLLGGLILVLALYAEGLKTLRRFSLLLCGGGILLLGASRGVVLGVIVAVAAEQARKYLGAHRSESAVKRAIGAAIATLVLVVTGAFFAPGLVERFRERFASALDIVTLGMTADSSATGRIGYWRAALRLLGRYPLGTLGSPELTLGSAVDNEYVRFLLQGSLVYVGAYVLMLFSALHASKGSRNGAVLRSVVVVVAVAALTQTPLSYAPTMVMLWFLLGARLGEKERTVAEGSA